MVTVAERAWYQSPKDYFFRSDMGLNQFLRLKLCALVVAQVAVLGIAAPTAHAADVICRRTSTGLLTVRPACLRGEVRIRTVSSLTGPSGPTGAAGAAGATGPTGPSGLSGGTITGVYQPYANGCAANNQSALRGKVEIGGTSYGSSFLANGAFTMYNVGSGTYTLSLTALNGNSFPSASVVGFGASIASSVVVTEGNVTNVGTIIGNNSCCGNGTAETIESCDGVDLKGASCVSRGYTSGTLACRANCFFDESGCVS
jgi:hypothetical protein